MIDFTETFSKNISTRLITNKKNSTNKTIGEKKNKLKIKVCQNGSSSLLEDDQTVFIKGPLKIEK